MNPAARRAALAQRAAVLDALRTRWQTDVVTPTSRQGTLDAARAAVRDGYDAVVAAGGDGTAGTVATGVAGSHVAYGLLPAGTANDFARALGIPRTPLAAARALVRSGLAPLDLLRVGDRCVCTVVGAGIVADSALAAARLRAESGAVRRLAHASGAAIYRLTASAALLRRAPLADPIELHLTHADGTIEHVAVRSPGLFVANQPYLGGGLRLPGVAPDADGLAEALVVQDTSRARLLDAFARLSLGWSISTRVLATHRVRALTLVAPHAQTVVGDGDAVASGRELTIEVLPNALHVLR